MNIGTVIPGQQSAVTPAATQQVATESPAAQIASSAQAASMVLSGGQDFQVNLGNIFRSSLENLLRILNQQESLLQHLSPDVAQTVRLALKQPFTLQTAWSQGIVSFTKAPKTLLEQLTQLATIMEDAAKIQQQAPRGVPQDVQKALADVEKQIQQILTQIKNAVNQAKTAEQAGKTNAGLANKSGLPIHEQGILSQPAAAATAFNQAPSQEKPVPLPQESAARTQQLKEGQSQPAAREMQKGSDHLPTSGRLTSLTAQVLECLPQEQLIKSLFQQLSTSTSAGKNLFPDATAAAKQLHKTETEKQSLLRQMANQAEQSMPKIIQQAASHYDMLQLKQAWIALRMNEALAWTKQPRATLERDAQIIKEIASLIEQTVSFTSETQGKGQGTLNFSLPLYFGDSSEPYPAHIHIFHQQEDDTTAEAAEFETWMKISLMTEHMGQVDTVFRLYKKELLDIRIQFSDEEAAEMFNGFVPAIRAEFNDSDFSLKLTDIMIGAT